MRALPPLLAAALCLLPASAALPVPVPAAESPLTGDWRVGGPAAAGGPRAGLDCCRFHRGKGDLYAYRDGDTLEVYEAAPKRR